MNSYEQIMAIIPRDKGGAAVEAGRLAGALGGAVARAQGTVSSHIRDMLGLADQKWDLVLLMSRKSCAARAVAAIYDRFNMKGAGRGIVLSVPLTASKGLNAMYRLRDQLDAKEHHDAIDRQLPEEEIMEQEYELLNVIVKSGFAEDAMDAARGAGAEGGTILRGRGMSVHENVKLFGVAIEPEKDILLIVIKKELRDAVMEAVVAEAGLDKPGQGIVYALPVSRVMGITHHARAGH